MRPPFVRVTIDYLYGLMGYSLFFVISLQSIFLNLYSLSVFLFGLFMKCMFMAKFAKLFQFELVLLHLFIPCGRVIPPLAFGALKGDYLSHLLPV